MKFVNLLFIKKNINGGMVKNLKSSIAIRILDSIGIVSKDMIDVRNEKYLTKYKNKKFYSGKTNYSSDGSLVFIYLEDNDMKYMISFIQNNKEDVGDIYLCIISSDIENESSEYNKLLLGTKKNFFREVSYLEAAKFLNTFEVLRNHMPVWLYNKPSDKQLDYLLEFSKLIKIN
jgi:hypothetical protein